LDGASDPEFVESSVSHELLESLTDPGATGGWSAAFTANDCGQIADLCQSEGFHIQSMATGTNWRMDRMWSNAANSCQTTTSVPVALKVLDKGVEVPNWTSANGTPVDISDCTGDTNQQWFLNSNGTISPAFALNKCVDLPNGNTTNGTTLGIWDCNGGTNQRWTRYADGTIRGVGGKCIDNPDWQTANGTQFDYWGCNGGRNQTFHLKKHSSAGRGP